MFSSKGKQNMAPMAPAKRRARPGHIAKDCRKLKYNNEQKVKSSEGLSTSAVKTIGDLKEKSIFMLKNGNTTKIIDIKNNQVKIGSEALKEKENFFLIDTGADLNIIKNNKIIRVHMNHLKSFNEVSAKEKK